MLKVHVIQAEYGDCLILEHGTSSKSRYILIDGGPATIYQMHLRRKLQEIRSAGGRLDLAVLSHVDDDHIAGLLDLMADLQQQRHDGVAETIDIAALWHNSFSQTLGQDVETRFRQLMQKAAAPRELRPFSSIKERSIGQGDALTQCANALHLPLNSEFSPQGLVCVDEAPDAITFGSLRLRVVGPTQKNLEMLKKKWLTWLKKQEKTSLTRGPVRATEDVLKSDESVPNLSSIMLLAEADDKTILLTGDGRWNDLLRGLAQANLLDIDGKLHVDVLKLPHHGSQRNVSRKFFATVTADRYVICANGRDDNPDLNTLKWIVEIAREAGRPIEILVTKSTDSTRRLKEKYDPAKYTYRLIELDPHENAMTIALAPE
jgi:beta-lactamase superfamily II metal-dependent hydrolase